VLLLLLLFQSFGVGLETLCGKSNTMFKQNWFGVIRT
jgi:hypothetical protein